jgi:hypothetical protein
MTVIQYSNAPDLQFWQGIRYLSDNFFIMCGTNQNSKGIFYIGPLLNYNNQNNYEINYPDSNITSVYGPDYVGKGIYRLVGSYRKDLDKIIYGFFFQGEISNFNNPLNYKTISVGASYTYIHSTMNNILVGNYDEYMLGPISAFLMIIDIGKIIKISYPGSTSNTVYGVWYNGDSNYTLCGGYSTDSIPGNKVYNNFQPKPIGKAYIVNYNINKNEFSDWTTFEYPYSEYNLLTHFQGISSNKKNVYQLVTDTINDKGIIASFVEIHKNKYNNFVLKKWVDYKYPLPNTVTSSNSVANNSVVGTYIDKENKSIAFQASIL